jgi:hypothetical protein
MSLEKKKPDDHKDQPQKENKDGDPVDPMHIPHPGSIRGIGVPLLNVEIFSKLSPYTHS